MHSMSTLVTTAARHDAQHKNIRCLSTTSWFQPMHIFMQVWLSLRFSKTRNSLVHQHTHMHTNLLYWWQTHACGKSHLVMRMLSRTHSCKTKCFPKLENPQLMLADSIRGVPCNTSLPCSQHCWTVASPDFNLPI